MAAIPRPLRLELARLRQRDNWRNVLYIGSDWLVVAAAVAASLLLAGGPLGIAVYIAAVLLIGSRQRALMILVHQASHRKLFASRRANDWVGRLFVSFPLLTSLESYVCAHCRHHGFLWDQEKDPKVPRYRELGLVRPTSAPRSFARKHLLGPLLLRHTPINVKNSLSWHGEPGDERLARVVYWLAVAGLAVGFGWGEELLLYWAVPYLTSFQVIRYWTEMAEHAGLESDDPWLATRSWETHPIAAWFLAAHNDAYHLLHHLFPAIPHFRLAEAHRLMLQVPEYAAGHHCDGFFFQRRPDAPSVVQDIREPEAIAGHSLPALLTVAAPVLPGAVTACAEQAEA